MVGQGEWVGAPEGYKHHGRVWAQLRKTLVGTGWTIFHPLCTNRLRKQFSHLVGPPFVAVKVFPSPAERRALPIESSLTGECLMPETYGYGDM